MTNKEMLRKPIEAGNICSLNHNKMTPTPQRIKGWTELSKVEDSDTHRLMINVETCNGWVKEKANPKKLGFYLSTHTFYGTHYESMTRLLQSCGFNVELDNWDDPERRND